MKASGMLIIGICIGATVILVCTGVFICIRCRKRKLPGNNYPYTKLQQLQNKDRWPAVKPENEYDFHGYTVPKAISKLTDVLREKTTEAKSRATDLTVTFITGKGNHSREGEPQIKPAVIEHLEKENYGYDVDNSNPGRIRVFIPSDVSNIMYA